MPYEQTICSLMGWEILFSIIGEGSLILEKRSHSPNACDESCAREIGEIGVRIPALTFQKLSSGTNFKSRPRAFS